MFVDLTISIFSFMSSNTNKPNISSVTRRKFIKSTAAMSSLALMPGAAFSLAGKPFTIKKEVMSSTDQIQKSIIGEYGSWAAGLAKDPPEFSFRQKKYNDLDKWKNIALGKAKECVASPDTGSTPKATIKNKYRFHDLEVEELEWQLPYGRPTKAVVLKPANAKGKLPGILALHDHGGLKYFGLRKITRTSEKIHPLIEQHQQEDYEGRAWANEIARRGYVVLVHDTFAFASRRVLYKDMFPIEFGPEKTVGRSDDDPDNPQNVKEYNKWAGEHEHIMAKSLFSAGTTWPGVFLSEDQRALDVLCERDDVNANHVGCAGLSGGGLRTVYLGGLDKRIKCAVTVGAMSTWKDFVLIKSYNHTWMTFTPLLPKYLDYPEIFGLRVPLPTMVMNNNEDGLFTLSEMKRAGSILESVFSKAGAQDKLRYNFYQGKHKFDIKMQEDAFDWFDRWL